MARHLTHRNAHSETVYDTGRVNQKTVFLYVTCSVRNSVIETTVIDSGEDREGQAERDEHAQRENRDHSFMKQLLRKLQSLCKIQGKLVVRSSGAWQQRVGFFFAEHKKLNS